MGWGGAGWGDLVPIICVRERRGGRRALGVGPGATPRRALPTPVAEPRADGVSSEHLGRRRMRLLVSGTCAGPCWAPGGRSAPTERPRQLAGAGARDAHPRPTPPAQDREEHNVTHPHKPPGALQFHPPPPPTLCSRFGRSGPPFTNVTELSQCHCRRQRTGGRATFNHSAPGEVGVGGVPYPPTPPTFL